MRVPPGSTTLTLTAAPEAEVVVVEPLAFVAFTGQSQVHAPTVGIVGPDTASGAVERWAVITDTHRSPYAWLRLVIEHAAGAPPPILWAPLSDSGSRVVALGVIHHGGGQVDEVRAFDWRAGGFLLPVPGPGR